MTKSVADLAGQVPYAHKYLVIPCSAESAAARAGPGTRDVSDGARLGRQPATSVRVTDGLSHGLPAGPANIMITVAVTVPVTAGPSQAPGDGTLALSLRDVSWPAGPA